MSGIKFPPRAWLSVSFKEGWQPGAQYVNAYKDSKFESDIEYISREEVDALICEARAKCLMAAARMWTREFAHKEYFESLFKDLAAQEKEQKE